MTGVDVNDPNFDVFEFLGVDWCKSPAVEPSGRNLRLSESMTTAANAKQVVELSVLNEDVRSYYEAFVRRRHARGELSIRTPEGFQRLQKKYGSQDNADMTKTIPEDGKVESEPETSADIRSEDSEVEAAAERNVASAFLNPKISRVITEACWRLANFGGGATIVEAECDGLELDEDKYSTFTFRLIQWVFPELPRRELHYLAHYDWEQDRKFDEAGTDGLSLQGFKLSMMDIAMSCTVQSKCLEFLILMARWLQHSLPPYPTRNTIPQVVKDFVKATSTLPKVPTKTASTKIQWHKIPLSMMTPCQIGHQGLHCEMKLKWQGCWTFSINSNTPLIILVPSASISRQTKSLYAYFQNFVSGKQTADVDNNESESNSKKDVQSQLALPSSLVTLFTSIPEQCSVPFGSKKGVSHRMERMSARIFTVDHRVVQGDSFSVNVAASLLQSTNAAGGAGAAATISSTFEAKSTFIVREDQWTGCPENDRHLAHSFVFVFKTAQSAMPNKSGLKQEEATLPQQWFTCLNAANEKKTIIIDTGAHRDVKCSAISATDKTINKEQAFCKHIYRLFVFTLHGIYIEVSCDVSPIQSKTTEDSDGEDIDSNNSETNDHNEFTADSQMLWTSAGLLKELLFLQKMRQLEKTSEAPPDFVIGTRVTTTKPVTTAESLRTKVLYSREDERRERFLLQAAIRDKLTESKPRQRNANHALVPEVVNKSVENPPSQNSELEKRVNLLTTFFHEMAVHQPKLEELHSSAVEAAEAAAEEQLITRFGDIFDRDVDLQNALDEEKWSTDAAKVIRRRDSISTSLPKTMLAEDILGTRDQIDEGVCTPWTFEDYANTAQYIEQLLIDVETNTARQQELQDLEDAERKDAVMTQLIASWQYTQHRVNKTATRRRLNEIEQKRKNHWMQSQHVQVYGAVTSAKRADKPERPALVLPKQRFIVEEQSLPSNAIWEVPCQKNDQNAVLLSGPIAAAGLVSPSRLLSPCSPKSPLKLLPQRPPQRPKTVATTERPSNIVALQSAAISRARVRRIRSATPTSQGNHTPTQSCARRNSAVLESKGSEQTEQKVVHSQQASVSPDKTQAHDKFQQCEIAKKHVNFTDSPVGTNEPTPQEAIKLATVVVDEIQANPRAAETTNHSTATSPSKEVVARKKRSKKKIVQQPRHASDLGYELPAAGVPKGNYVNVVRTGNYIYTGELTLLQWSTDFTV
ncbi:unnamed protein product [Phytophthora lilii]|uniref:Unnamed protein product n=1 Tax=Phytophthora lilii TaxID=2077276 RepID=A0A9W6UC41_9STRA|nr:unnamed protein product [Phytophthora lilii]